MRFPGLAAHRFRDHAITVPGSDRSLRRPIWLIRVNRAKFAQALDTAFSNVISNIAWEPYGGLRGYQINHPGSSTASSVEYVLGEYANPPGPGTCPSAIPGAPSSGTERAGRLKALWVSTLPTGQNFSPGSGNGAIEKMSYTFQADQVKQIDTCLLDATVPRTEIYGPDSLPGYDQLLRLTNAGRWPTGNFAATGGAFNSRSYGYSGRGNRISETREDCAYALTYGNATHPDQLTQQASSCPSSILSHRYAYDADGRVYLKTWENDSSQTPAYSINLSYGETDTASHGALDTVFKGVGVNGMAYDYFYDAQNRRRLKVYPLGATDEFFYGMGHQMLVDQGNDSSAAPSFYPDDDYIWLGGRPVVLIRGKLDTSWNRQADSTGDCTRNGDAAACGFYFPVTDHVGKPVLMLDSQRRVAGTGEFDVSQPGQFGQGNAASLPEQLQRHPGGLYPTQGKLLCHGPNESPPSPARRGRQFPGPTHHQGWRHPVSVGWPLWRLPQRPALDVLGPAAEWTSDPELHFRWTELLPRWTRRKGLHLPSGAELPLQRRRDGGL